MYRAHISCGHTWNELESGEEFNIWLTAAQIPADNKHVCRHQDRAVTRNADYYFRSLKAANVAEKNNIK